MASDLPVTATPEANGSTRLDLMLDGRAASRLWIVPFTIRIGAATVRMDGIGGVGTEPEYRMRGLARRVLEAAVERMRAGGDGPPAALSMLYGIQNMYHRFGFATAGPDYRLRLIRLAPEVRLPEGWRVRPFRREDSASVRALYDGSTARAVGAAVRAPDAASWRALLASTERPGPEQCRVVLGPDSRVRGYAWRGQGFWYLDNLERHVPDTFFLSEVMADAGPQGGHPAAAEAVLAACRLWACEEAAARDASIVKVETGLPPEGAVAAAACFQSSEFAQRYSPAGESMARVLSVERLMAALEPELESRLRAARWPLKGTLGITTDLDDVDLRIDASTVTTRAVAPGSESPDAGGGWTLRLPQSQLARLALGAFAPDDILDCLEDPPGEETRELVRALFPHRHPHMYFPDRF